LIQNISIGFILLEPNSEKGKFVAHPTDQELDELLDQCIDNNEAMPMEYLRRFARLVLQKWGK
jgi:hypothetical protein